MELEINFIRFKKMESIIIFLEMIWKLGKKKEDNYLNRIDPLLTIHYQYHNQFIHTYAKNPSLVNPSIPPNTKNAPKKSSQPHQNPPTHNPTPHPNNQSNQQKCDRVSCNPFKSKLQKKKLLMISLSLLSSMWLEFNRNT
jgi:hypothetical protein